MDILLTVEQVAIRLHSSPQTIYKFIKEGKIKAHQIGRKLLVKEQDLIDYIETTKREIQS